MDRLNVSDEQLRDWGWNFALRYKGVLLALAVCSADTLEWHKLDPIDYEVIKLWTIP